MRRAILARRAWTKRIPLGCLLIGKAVRCRYLQQIGESHAQEGWFSSSFEPRESGSGGPRPGGDGAGGPAETPGETTTRSGTGAGASRPESRLGAACSGPICPGEGSAGPAGGRASSSSRDAACPGGSGSCRTQAAGAAGRPAAAPGPTACSVLWNRAAHDRGGWRSCRGA